MSLALTEDQEEIRRTTRAFVQERAPVTHMRELRDRADATGFSRELWRELAGLGVVGLLLPERYGGAGLGMAELGLVLEELGRNLVPTPMLSTVVLGGGLVLAAGSQAQRQAWLPAIGAGERVLALAHEEGARHAPWAIGTHAERTPGGYRLNGHKSFVLDGHVADALIVVARTGEGLTLFLVPADRPGLARHRLSLVDSRNAARVELLGVEVSEADVLGKPGEAEALLQPVLDRGAVALAAEMFGGLLEAFERTIAYLKVRKQFGVPIGSFQALKHRAAHMFCEVELCRSVVLAALRALDDHRPDASLLASAAKAIQMHGGIGVTDELDVGLFYKRARVAEMTLGGVTYHRDRFAKLRGY
jgi:acyl-CoA dehydrogenase